MTIAIIVIASLLVLFLLSHLLVIYLVFRKFFCRIPLDKIDKIYDKNPIYDDSREEIYAGKDFLLKEKHLEVEITSFDNLKLKGYFYDYGFDRCALLVHGTHSDPFLLFGVEGQRLIKDGYNLLIVDLRTHNQSEGKYISYGKYEAKDILDWVKYIKEELHQKSLLMYGMSMGAVGITLASIELDENYVEGMVLDCGYTSIDDLVNHLTTSQRIPSFLFLGGVKFLAKHFINVSFDDFVTSDYLEKTKIPAFFISGTLDKVATKEFLMNNYNKCASRKDYLLIEGAAHTLASVVGGENAHNRIMNFINNRKV